MKPTNVCLSASEISLVLSCDLPSDEAAAAERHIADCATCRSAIESIIADSRWWDDARHSLTAGATRSAHSEEVAHDAQPTTTEQMLELLGPTDDPAMLGRIGNYEIVGILGHGGMGIVFKGYDGALNRFVAIKMLLPHLAASGAARQRFAREAQAAAAVVDDHVMAIHGVSDWKSVPYFVMPYARGVSLQKRLSNDGPLEVREILRIGMQAAKGLAAAHSQGLVHRDVKPANIFLDEGVERVQLMDFGLARAVDDASLTRSGTLAGTPQYMSPEQARAESVDHRSDLFSLGSVLYAMCTGHAPFRAESSYSVLRLITDKEPRPIREINPETPEWLCLLVSRLMEKCPDARFGNALEVATLLEQCLAHVQHPTSVSLPASLVPHAAGRRSIFNVTRQGALALLGMIGMTVLGMLLLQATEAPDISGQWISDEWGTVVLEAKGSGEYQGTFNGTGKDKPVTKADAPVGGPSDGPIGIVDRSRTMETPNHGVVFGDFDSVDKMGRVVIDKSGPAPLAFDFPLKSGSLHLTWSRLERRFNGTWGKGVNRSGTMSLRLVEKEIRGGWTTDEDVQLESGTPRLGDLLWKRLPQQSINQAASATTESIATKSANRSSYENPVAKPDWVVAWDFRYTLLNERYAMMRVSRDGKMEALFPERSLLRAQLSPDELSVLVDLVAKNPQARSQPMAKVAEYSQAVSARPELFDAIKKVNVRSEIAAVFHEGELLELELNSSEGHVVEKHLWKLVGLAAIGGSKDLLRLVDVANRELKRKYPIESRQIDPTHFSYGLVDQPSGNISVWFNFSVDPESKDGQVILRVPQDGQPSIEEVGVTGVTREGKRKPDRDLPSTAVPLIESPKVQNNVPDTNSSAVNGSPLRPKLADKRYAKSGVPFAEQTLPIPLWGVENDGLSAGLRIIGDARVGGEVKAELWVRNSGENDVKFSRCHRVDVGLSIVAKDKDGKEHFAEITSFRGYPIFHQVLLPAGHVVKVKEFTIKLVSRKNDELERGWVSLDLPPGDYKLHANWTDTTSRAANEGEWAGKLTTGDVDLKIGAADAGTVVGKPTEKPFGENIVTVPDEQYVKSGRPVNELAGEGLTWNEVQNGLSLGYRMTSDEWRILGKDVKIELWVWNPGDKDVKFQLNTRPDIGLQLNMKKETSAKGEKELLHHSSFVPNRRPPFGWHRLLPPGHALQVMEFTVSLLGQKNDLSKLHGHYFVIEPGRYKFHCELEIPGFSGTGGGKQFTLAAGEWTGSLTTREVAITVVAPDSARASNTVDPLLADAKLPEAIPALTASIVTVTRIEPAEEGTGDKAVSHAGIVVDPRGYIVIPMLPSRSMSTRFMVRFADLHDVVGQLIAIDETLKFGVLKIENPQPVAAISLTKNYEARVDDRVMLVPSPASKEPRVGRITSTTIDLGEEGSNKLMQSDVTFPLSEYGSLMVSEAAEPIGIVLASRIDPKPESIVLPLKHVLSLIQSAIDKPKDAPLVTRPKSSPAIDLNKPVQITLQPALPAYKSLVEGFASRGAKVLEYEEGKRLKIEAPPVVLEEIGKLLEQVGRESKDAATKSTDSPAQSPTPTKNPKAENPAR